MAGLNYLIVDKGSSVCEFFKAEPRHRTLISINKVYPGDIPEDEKMRYDWNSLLLNDFKKFGDYTEEYFPPADNVVKYMQDAQDKFKLNIVFNKSIVRVSKCKETMLYNLTDSAGEVLKCKYLIVAAGWTKENIPKYIEGVEGVLTYGTHSIDRSKYKNKKVLIIGKGNSALETADHLIPVAAKIHLISPQPALFAWNTRYVGHIRAVNNNFFDTY